MFVYPDFSPVAIRIYSIDIYWYGLSYALAFILSYLYLKNQLKTTYNSYLSNLDLDNLLFYIFLGILIGGRVFYILFYFPNQILSDPLSLFKFYAAGRSFHGGLIGVITAAWIFSKRYKYSFWLLMDFVAPAAAIGIFCGRIGNFLNGELIGRVSGHLPWAMVYPELDLLPRHPSQIYESLFEGGLVFILLHFFTDKKHNYFYGKVSALFAIYYSMARIACEFFRDPDVTHGFVFLNKFTMGQVLTLPLLIIGILILLIRRIKCSNI